MVDAVEFLVGGCLTFFANVAFAMTSFGSGVIFQTGWHVAHMARLTSGSVVEATTRVSVFMAVTRTIQMVHLRESRVDWIVAHMLPATLCGLVVGVVVIFRLPGTAARQTMGCLFLSIMAFKYASTRPHH